MAEHELRIWPSYFDAIAEGRKTFEVRKADRDYQVGDVLVLKEFSPGPFVNQDGDFEQNGYTGRKLRAKVIYLMRLGDFAWEFAVVIMGIYVEPDQEPTE